MKLLLKAAIIICIVFPILVMMTIFDYLFFGDKSDSSALPHVQNQRIEGNTIETTNNQTKLVDFSKINAEFLFSAEIPRGFSVEYLPSVGAINVYDPRLSAPNNREKSQLYITFFKASRFLTLNTVAITRQDSVTIKGKDAILYEITKNPQVLDFADQPSWRNATHKALDIRFSANNPTVFYSFAYNPVLSESIFTQFIDSLIFHSEN